MRFIQDCCTCCTRGYWGRWIRPVVLVAIMGAVVRCGAQTDNLAPGDFVAMNAAAGPMASAVDLPDAPEPQQQAKPDPDANKPLVAATPKEVANSTMPVAPKFSKYIPAGYAVEQIHGREKLVIATRDLVSVGNIGDWFLSAGWEQLFNSQPNYGTDRGAFGERLGAAAIRETSEGILTDGVFCVMLHEDPRYFVQGEQTGFVHRTLYAVSRPLITRSSNDGHAMPNYGLWLGLASATATTNLYYPVRNRNVGDSVTRFTGSLEGAALGYAFDEFRGDLTKRLHRNRQ